MTNQLQFDQAKTMRGPLPALNPKAEVGLAIEMPCRMPIVAGRVTPCAPRLQPECFDGPQRAMPNSFPIRAFPRFLVPTSVFGLEAP
jgi:hypothetical protein